MALYVYRDVHASGSVSADWTAFKGGTLKYPVRNRAVSRYLRELLPGAWHKVIKNGSSGEVHYFEHASDLVNRLRRDLRTDESSPLPVLGETVG